MSYRVRVRPVAAQAAGDIAHIHRLSRAWYYSTEPEAGDEREAMWTELLAEPGRLTYLAESAGIPTGFISAIRIAGRRPVLELTSLYVLPDRMGSGIGSQLYDQYDADRSEDEEGVLEVWKGNLHAVAFYARRGWIATETTRRGPQGTDFVTYRLAARARG